MVLIGIDPGVTGAACAFDDVLGPADLVDLPMIRDGKKAKQLDVLAFSRWLHQVGASRVVIEHQWPRPEEGSVGAFRSGLIFGQLRATTQVNGIPLSLVTPARWKGYLGISSEKNVSRGMVRAKFPALEDQLTRVMDHNRAEAVLIALWGVAHWRGLAAGTV